MSGFGIIVHCRCRSLGPSSEGPPFGGMMWPFIVFHVIYHFLVARTVQGEALICVMFVSGREVEVDLPPPPVLRVGAKMCGVEVWPRYETLALSSRSSTKP